jgi:hypothetical protein
MTQAKSIESYLERGFKVEHKFPGEYVLLRDEHWNKVRVYENGTVWETNSSGEYVKTKG